MPVLKLHLNNTNQNLKSTMKIAKILDCTNYGKGKPRIPKSVSSRERFTVSIYPMLSH